MKLNFAMQLNTLSAIIFLLVLGIAQSVQAGEKSDTQIKSETRVYEVFGMGCPACQGGLAKLVKKIDGVSEAKVNWKEQRVAVTFSEGAEADDEQIFEAIRKANFTPGKRIDESGKEGDG